MNVKKFHKLEKERIKQLKKEERQKARKAMESYNELEDSLQFDDHQFSNFEVMKKLSTFHGNDFLQHVNRK